MAQRLLLLVFTACLLTWARTNAVSLKPKHLKIHDNPAAYAGFAQPLDAKLDTIHLLGRVTFGPKPGDAAVAEKQGLEQWLDAQLHPERVPENPELVAKLRPYESLAMSPRQTFLRYPSPQLIAAVARGNAKLPEDPELRAVVASLAERYLRKTTPNTPGADDFGVEGRVPLTSILSTAQVEQLRKGTGPGKAAVLQSISVNERMSFVWALSPAQRRSFFALAPVELRRDLMLSVNPQRVVQDDLSEAKILRAVYSSHQLQELLIDFWFNHFNVFLDKGADRFLVPSYERDAIRPHVFGRFYDLLLATAQSPAMLFYLDNWQSNIKRGLNENYGRELLELHTLGVDGGYTQKDVIEVARCFTGWTIKKPNQGGEFEFNEKVHDKGQKVVLGHVIQAGGGMDDGLTVLQILAASPVTAHHISLQLAQRFVADDPPPSLINRMTKTYLQKNGDLREVLRTMFHSPEFWSEGAYRAKVKMPLELVAGALRATGAQVDSAFVLDNELQKLGEPLYRKIEPTGYSSANAEWMNSAALLERLNFSLALSRNQIAGVHVNPACVAADFRDPVAVATLLLQQAPSTQTQAAIAQAAASVPAALIGLTLGSPDFQRR